MCDQPGIHHITQGSEVRFPYLFLKCVYVFQLCKSFLVIPQDMPQNRGIPLILLDRLRNFRIFFLEILVRRYLFTFPS